MQVDNPPKITHHQLLTLADAAKGRIKHLYLHWSAGRYHQFFDDYHLNIDSDGSVYCTCCNLLERKAHTWKRNTGAVGITLCCGLGATYNSKVNFGEYPPTQAQITSMAWVVAILCTALNLPVKYEVVATHGEVAVCDGYGPGSGDPETRWDLFWVPNFAAGKGLRQGGSLVRLLAHTFSQKLQQAGKESLQVPLLTEHD